MQKTPVYIGIFCEDAKKGAKDLRGYSKECIEKIKEKHEDIAVHKDHEMLDEVFEFPKDNHHITSLFIGGNHKKLSNKGKDNYANFEHGKKVNVKIDYFVYVPNYIMVGFCSKVEEVNVDNKHPHVTLMLTK